MAFCIKVVPSETTMDHIPHDPQTTQPPIPAIEWRIQGAQRLDPLVLRPLLGADAKASGEAVVRAYKQHGILAVRVRIEGTDQDRTMLITEPKVRARGDYAHYLPQGEDLTQSALDTSLARAQAEARANNSSLYVEIGAVDAEGFVDVFLLGEPNQVKGSDRNLAVSTTSFGPRYSGSDVVVLSGSVAKGNGVMLDASATVGLADLRDDSKGGKYLGLSAGVSKASEYGLVSLRGTHSRFKVGGPNADLDQTGEVTKAEAEWSYALNANITPFVGATATHQVSRIGVAGWSDAVTSTAIKAGVKAQKTWPMERGFGVLSGDVTLEQGLTASRRLDAPGPLLGDIDPHYRSLSSNADLSIPVSEAGARLAFSAGAQKASSGTPSGSQFYAGGPGRGVSYHTGVYAAPSGFYGSVQWTSSVLDKHLPFAKAEGIHGVQAFAGLDAAQVRPVGGRNLTAKSLHLGVRFKISERVSGQVGYARPIGGDDFAKPRVTFFLTASF